MLQLMSRAQSCLFLVDSVAITMAGDAGIFLPLIRMLSSQKHRRPRLNGPPNFLSLLRYVGAGARIASAPVESAITMETKYITMETRDSLSRLLLCKNRCRPTSRCKTVCVTRHKHLQTNVIPFTSDSKHVEVGSVHAFL